MNNRENRNMAAGPGKRVKAAVRSNLRPLEQRQNALESRIDALAAKVEGDGPPMSEGEKHYAEWRAKQQAARTVEMTPYGVAFIHDATWDENEPLEPVDPSRYPCNPTPATSPTPTPSVPVRRFTVFKAVTKSVAVLGLLGFAAVGMCATGGLVAYRLGYVEIDQLAHGVSWLNEQSDWILSGAGLTGLMASARAAWPFIRARAWSALCEAVQQASQGGGQS